MVTAINHCVYDRQYVSMILLRTRDTSRQYDNLSAEWLGHNVMHAIPLFKEAARNVGLDKDADPRWCVRALTDILEFFGWE